MINSSKLVKGKIPRLSVTSRNNGIVGYFDTGNLTEARHYTNFISVNFLGNVFYHPYTASCEMKVHVLQLKGHDFTIETGLYIATALAKSISGNFSYGEQLSSSDLRNAAIFIELPVIEDSFAFDYIKQYVHELEFDRIRKLESYLINSGFANYELSEKEYQAIERAVDGGGGRHSTFKFNDIFAEAQTGDFDIQRHHVNGRGYLYINSGLENQGIVGSTDVPAKVFPANSITIDMFGLAWYRDFQYKMATHAHVFSLKIIKEVSPDALLYIVGAMRYIRLIYNFNNMCNWKKMKNNELVLPITSDKQIDYDYMENYIRALKKKIVKDIDIWIKDEFNL